MFRFNLQAVLDYREAKEKTLLLAFSEKKRLLDQELAIHTELTIKKEELRKKLHRLTGQTLAISELSLQLDQLRGMCDIEARQSLKVLEVHQEVELKRVELLERMKEKKALEILKSKKQNAYREWLDMRENKSIDELVVQRYQGSKS